MMIIEWARHHPRLRTAILFFLMPFLVHAAAAPGPGVVWDEAIYFGFAARYVRWFAGGFPHPFSEQTLFRVWRAGDVHPPIGKLISAAGFVVFGRLVDLTTAARLGACLASAGIFLALFIFMRSHRGERAAAFSVLSLFLMPRFFGHAHLASLEMPMVLTWLLTTIAFEKGIQSHRWSVLCGVFFGLALLTKINAVLLPVVLVPWGVLCYGRKAAWNLVAMAILGPIIFVMGWPGMWYHPVEGVISYLRDKARRFLIPVHYFGVTYADAPAPWHYPILMLLMTTPIPILLPAGAIFAQYLKESRRPARDPFKALLLLSFVVPIAAAMLPGVPKYDGVRLFLPAFPFLACMAGEGIEAMWRWCEAKGSKSASMAGGVLAILAIFHVGVLLWLHPYHLCYYNLLVAGPWGAKRLGMETTYWGDTFDSKALKYINRHCPEGGKVAFAAVGEQVYPWYHDVTNELRRDIGWGSIEEADWDLLVVVPRQGWLNSKEPIAANLVRSRKPVWANHLPGLPSVPICLIYSRATNPEHGDRPP